MSEILSKIFFLVLDVVHCCFSNKCFGFNSDNSSSMAVLTPQWWTFQYFLVTWNIEPACDIFWWVEVDQEYGDVTGFAADAI